MTTNARTALTQLTGALEAHLEAVTARRSADDAAVDDAFESVAEAFEAYEEALDAEYGESLPLVVDDSEEYDEDDDDEDDDDEELDPHAEEDEDELDDDIEEFELR